MKVTFRANLNDNGFNKDGTVTLEFERVQELELDLQPRMLRPDGTHRPLNQAETDDLDACLVEWEKKQLVRTLSEFIVHKEQS
jgi:hypothetical protein